jgi:hypothetical protein
MKNFLLGFVAAIVSLPVGALGYFWMGFPDAQSDVVPSVFESRLMGVAVHASVARSSAKLIAPIANDDILVRGGKLYVQGCQGCHGELGKPLGKDHSNYPRVPQLPYVGTGVYGASDLLGCEARNPDDGDVRVRPVLFRRPALVHRSVPAHDPKFAAGHRRQDPS